nr:MAG TPA: hypothetical protein [Caudoviricetes sp.]
MIIYNIFTAALNADYILTCKSIKKYSNIQRIFC